MASNGQLLGGKFPVIFLLCAAIVAADQWPHPRQAHETAVPASFDCAMRKLAYKVRAVFSQAQARWARSVQFLTTHAWFVELGIPTNSSASSSSPARASSSRCTMLST